MLYRAIRPLLFALDPESAHSFSLDSLDLLTRLGATPLLGCSVPRVPVRVMGLDFPNPVGLAAGLDKDGEHIDGLAALGFGFLEVGAVTPRPQAGNPAPRVFRLPQAEAMINRLGFNSRGVDAFVDNMRRSRRGGIVGVNIGRNADTPNERALEDYTACLRKVYPHASFVTANVSSPNTVGLRSLQAVDQLGPMLLALLRKRERLLPALGRNLPLLVKIAPDLDDQELAQLAKLLVELKIDGVIATNTTLQRSAAVGPLGQEKGGLSGAPLRELSLATVRKLRHLLGTQFPIIGVGGIASLSDAQAMRVAGADLVQLGKAGDFLQMRDASGVDHGGSDEINQLLLNQLLAIENRVENFADGERSGGVLTYEPETFLQFRGRRILEPEEMGGL